MNLGTPSLGTTWNIFSGLYSTMRSVHGFIRYTLEVSTIDEDGSENRSEREIVILSPMDERFDVSFEK